MAARRAERLVNLVICLLATRQYLSAQRIRDAVPGYESDGARSDGPRSDEAFKRMFERDKAELRDLGVPLEVGRNSIFDTEDGYRISRRDYELPSVWFDPGEAAAVGLAARLWQSASLGAPARDALMKLRAGGTDIDSSATVEALPHLDASDPALPALLDAARNAQPVRFDYRKRPGEAARRRSLQPWGVLSWHRRWYVAGLDTDRQAARCFRLSRIVGAVTAVGPAGSFQRPADVDLLALVAGRDPDEQRLARVAVSGDGGGQLRRVADCERDGVLTISYTDPEWLARLVAGAGASARVLEPPELVAAVVDRLRVVAGRAVTGPAAAGRVVAGRAAAVDHAADAAPGGLRR